MPFHDSILQESLAAGNLDKLSIWLRNVGKMAYVRVITITQFLANDKF